MASQMRGSSMRGGRVRRAMSEINVVPYIDVMLVLLVIFMVTAPLITPGTVDLPSISKASQAPATAIEVIIKHDGTLTVRNLDPKNIFKRTAANSRDMAQQVRDLLSRNPTSPSPVIIAADKTVPYEDVLKAMDALQKENVQHIGLSVQPAPAGS